MPIIEHSREFASAQYYGGSFFSRNDVSLRLDERRGAGPMVCGTDCTSAMPKRCFKAVSCCSERVIRACRGWSSIGTEFGGSVVGIAGAAVMDDAAICEVSGSTSGTIGGVVSAGSTTSLSIGC